MPRVFVRCLIFRPYFYEHYSLFFNDFFLGQPPRCPFCKSYASTSSHHLPDRRGTARRASTRAWAETGSEFMKQTASYKMIFVTPQDLNFGVSLVFGLEEDRDRETQHKRSEEWAALRAMARGTSW